MSILRSLLVGRRHVFSASWEARTAVRRLPLACTSDAPRDTCRASSATIKVGGLSLLRSYSHHSQLILLSLRHRVLGPSHSGPVVFWARRVLGPSRSGPVAFWARRVLGPLRLRPLAAAVVNGNYDFESARPSVAAAFSSSVARCGALFYLVLCYQTRRPCSFRSLPRRRFVCASLHASMWSSS